MIMHDMIYILLTTPRGGTIGNSWWGCAAQFSES